MGEDGVGRRAFLASAVGGTVGLGAGASSEAEPTQRPGLTMSLADFDASVKRVIASKRIGTPVFVRLTATGIAGKDAIALLSRLVPMVGRWLGQERSNWTTIGTGANVTLSLTFAGGASALISLTSSPSGGSPLDLLLVGNHGSVLHDFGQGFLGPVELSWQTMDADPALTEAFRKALS